MGHFLGGQIHKHIREAATNGVDEHISANCEDYLNFVIAPASMPPLLSQNKNKEKPRSYNHGYEGVLLTNLYSHD